MQRCCCFQRKGFKVERRKSEHVFTTYHKSVSDVCFYRVFPAISPHNNISLTHSKYIPYTFNDINIILIK